jgi:hypothetical protein
MSDIAKIPPKPKREKRGQPTKWSQQLQDEFAANLVLGLPIADCCALAHVDEHTYYNWQKQAENGKFPWVSFFQATKEANATFKRKQLQILEFAGTAKVNSVQWYPAAWLLERRDRPNYGRYDERADLNVSIKIDPKALSEQLKKIEGEEH